MGTLSPNLFVPHLFDLGNTGDFGQKHSNPPPQKKK
jgi:hypothetical protein